MLASRRETTQVTGEEPRTEGSSGGLVGNGAGGGLSGGVGVWSVIGGGV